MGKRSRRRGQDVPSDAPADAAADPAPDGAAPEEPAAPGGTEAERPRSTLADPRLREVMAYAEEADMLYHLYRWVLLKGGVPSARDWLPREDMPHPDAVADVFGSWQKFLDHAQLADSPLLSRLRALEERERELEGREKQV